MVLLVGASMRLGWVGLDMRDAHPVRFPFWPATRARGIFSIVQNKCGYEHACVGTAGNRVLVMRPVSEMRPTGWAGLGGGQGPARRDARPTAVLAGTSDKDFVVARSWVADLLGNCSDSVFPNLVYRDWWTKNHGMYVP